MKYKSITTPEIEHDEANLLAEFIFLNNNISLEPFSWRNSTKAQWGKLVSCIKKLIRDFNIEPDQLAFYIWKCHPRDINQTEFAKMAIVAKKLFKKHDLNALRTIYLERRKFLGQNEITKQIGYKYDTDERYKPKNLIDFLKELEQE